MKHKVRILTENAIEKEIWAKGNLLEALRQNNLAPEAICGGAGSCGKCKVWVDGEAVLACRTEIVRDIEVRLCPKEKMTVLTEGVKQAVPFSPIKTGYLIAVDIGTTTIVCYLLDQADGKELGNASMLNPQSEYGADVVTRIQAAMAGKMEEMVQKTRTGVMNLIEQLCADALITCREIGVIALVGNPTMQQLFFGITLENLIKIPFYPVFTKTEIISAKEYLAACKNAELLLIPDISGYIGADTIGAVLACGMDQSDKITLLVDIGTNGEMVLGNQNRMIACSTAAGPALEGAGIRFGMRGADGAIDHVWTDGGKIQYHVIGEREAKGICGSGIIDAAAAALDMGVFNERGRIAEMEEIDGTRIWRLSENVYLTQEDIRAVQLAKGAIAAGIEQLALQYGISIEAIDQVYLAGAFGSYLDKYSACRIGLLPLLLEKKIISIGNAAGSGAKQLVCCKEQMEKAQRLAEQIEVIELSESPDFQKIFAKCMKFPKE